MIISNNDNIVKDVKLVKAINAIKPVTKERSVEMPDTEISRWQAFDAGKHLAQRRPENPPSKTEVLIRF